jgi:hypothetical protein
MVRDPAREIVRFRVRLGDSSGAAWEVPLDVPLFPDAPALSDFRVLDGATVPLWHNAVKRADQSLGAGNADGIANPGETIAIAAPDEGAFRAVELFSSDRYVNLDQRLSDLWATYDHVGNSAKVSLALISSRCPEGHEITFFARYWHPDKPEHVLKQGVVRVRVTGRDRTPPQVGWVQTSGWNRLEVRLRDGGRVRSAIATLTNGDTTLKVPLNDDGQDADLAAADGVFSGLLPNPRPGAYKLTISAEDEFGNAADVPVQGELHFSLPSPELSNGFWEQAFPRVWTYLWEGPR